MTVTVSRCDHTRCSDLGHIPGTYDDEMTKHRATYCLRHAADFVQLRIFTPDDSAWPNRYGRGFDCPTCLCTGRTIHADLPDGSERAQTCFTCSGSGRARKSGTQDDRLLADLFRRALKADMIEVEMAFKPSFRIELRAGLRDDTRIPLTDGEVEALRRTQ